MMFGFLCMSSLIFSIFFGVEHSYSTPDRTFHDQPPHQLIKRQNGGDVSSCEIPVETTDKTYTITESNGNLTRNPQPGAPVSKWALLELRCVRGYAFRDRTNSSFSYCSKNGSWQPSLKPCIKFCEPLVSDNMDLSCRFEGRDIDCSSGALLSGTIVTPRCKDLFRRSQKHQIEYTSIQCQDNGRWNNTLYRCVPDCGKPMPTPIPPNAAIGGVDAAIGEVPWHVAIFSLKAVEPLICSGTLIATNVVVSAAHCFYDAVKKVTRKNPADYEIAVAKVTRDRTKIDHPVQKTFQIADIIFYDRPYDPLVTDFVYDIALVILKGSVTISPQVLPACLGDDTRRGFNPRAGELGLMPGWGLTETGRPSDVLQTIEIPFMNSTECVRKITIVTVDKFCAGDDTGPRPQKGDSGGGLVFRDSHSHLYYVRGIVSTSNRYSDLSITTFTDISYYMEWIEKILEDVGATEERSVADEDGCPSLLTFRGCYEITPKSSLLINRISNNHTTPEACVEFCATWQNSFAGISNIECLCGQFVLGGLLKRNDSECNYPCQGSCFKKWTCGGESKVSIYETGVKVQEISSTNTTKDKCKISDSTRNGQPLCQHEIMLKENFDTLNTSRWKYSVRMATDPDYEFVTYSKSPKVVYVKGGKLYIKPMLWLEYARGERKTLIGCTGTPRTDECTRTASTANILPPVLSAQITTADSLSFRYGRLDIRAKFPSGDWIVPQIWLTPKQPSYGARYASGQIRIAYIRGNTNLLCSGKELGSRTVQGGMVFGPANYTVMLMNRSESAEEWSKDFHNYSLLWTKENLSFLVDGKVLARYPQQPADTVVSAAQLPQNVRYIGSRGSKLAPFDKEFYITLGVSVGGLRDFPDSCVSNGTKKPWTNSSPSKAMLNFWEKRDGWKGSWSGDGPALQIDHIQVAAL